MQEAIDFFEIQEVVEVGHKTDISVSTSLTISERVCKLFLGMSWFAGNIDGIRQADDGNIYDILFEDGDTEEWCQDKYNKNDANACITIDDVGFRFIKNFSGRSFFSVLVVGIQSNDKRKWKFDEDVYIHNYTLNQPQAYYTNQTAVYNSNDNEGTINNGRDDDDEGNGNSNYEANEPE